MRRDASAFNIVSVALGLAFLYLPIVILVIYSFNASRLVTVWGGWSLRWYARALARRRHAAGGLDQPAGGGAVGDARHRARHLRGGRAHALGPFPRRGCCSPAWSMRRW